MKSETVLQRKKKLSSLLERLEPWIYIAAAVIGIAAVVLVGLVDFSMIRDYELALSIGFVLWACSLSICFLGMSKYGGNEIIRDVELLLGISSIIVGVVDLISHGDTFSVAFIVFGICWIVHALVFWTSNV